MANYKCTNVDFTFCQIAVIDSWALKDSALFTIFLQVKANRNLINSISNYFGQPDETTQIQINKMDYPITYNWHKFGFNVILKKYSTVFDSAKLKNSMMIIFGTNKFKDVIITSGHPTAADR